MTAPEFWRSRFATETSQSTTLQHGGCFITPRRYSLQGALARWGTSHLPVANTLQVLAILPHFDFTPRQPQLLPSVLGFRRRPICTFAVNGVSNLQTAGKQKSCCCLCRCLAAVLLLPYPMPGRGLSVSYYMSWAEGQAKILLSFLLLLSFYLGYRGKPVFSGVIFALGAFDPRFALLALPLFLFYNKSKLKAH